ncbi:KorB domain-containing protein [Luteimonas soli]|uniref:KorB domain-containing protein n=1 Tax=Luteimonas soli TaxID=1648966 RepID=A0ABV7XIP7_9GAMM
MPKDLRTVRHQVQRARRLTVVDQYQAIVAEIRAGYSQDEIAQRHGISKQWVNTYAAIVKMPPYLQDALRRGQVGDVTALVELFRISERSKAWADVVFAVVKSGRKLTRKLVHSLDAEGPGSLAVDLAHVPSKMAASCSADSEAEALLLRFQEAARGPDSCAAIAHLQIEVEAYFHRKHAPRDRTQQQSGASSKGQKKGRQADFPARRGSAPTTTLDWITANYGGPLLTAKDVGSILGRSPQAILQAAQQGLGDPQFVQKLRACRAQIGRRVMFRAADIAAMIDAA